jgi:hypothetical protein
MLEDGVAELTDQLKERMEAFVRHAVGEEPLTADS